MTTPTRDIDEAAPRIRDKRELVERLAGGSKPKTAWRIGTEHEKFVYRTADFRAPSYDEPGGIRDLLAGLAADYGWEPVIEGGNVIALAGSTRQRIR